jgi:DNA-binding GntR family transcriptional regulator
VRRAITDPTAVVPASQGKRDAAAHAYESLRTMIVKGTVAPGSELSQVSLARSIGVSTTPIREALRQLEAEGLVESRRNRRPRVLPFDPADLETVYGNRILLESLGIALSVPVFEEADLAMLRDRLDAMRSTATRHAIEEWDEAHASFHLGLVCGCSAPLRQQIASMLTRSDRYRRMATLARPADGPAYRPDGALRDVGEQDHAEILASCEARRPGDAAMLLARHLTRSALRVVASMAPQFDPLGVRLALEFVSAWAISMDTLGRTKPDAAGWNEIPPKARALP